MLKLRRLAYILIFASLAAGAFPIDTLAQAKQASTRASGKKAGFIGDPARKRGIEIGFDNGKKAGKQDKSQNLKPDPKRHENYLKPEKHFRSEYGSQANFVAGFRGGFMSGYQSAFGKKIPLPQLGLTENKPQQTLDAAVKPSTGHTASDAL